MSDVPSELVKDTAVSFKVDKSLKAKLVNKNTGPGTDLSRTGARTLAL